MKLIVPCLWFDTEGEEAANWDALGAGGEHGPCGWLKDRFGRLAA